MDNAKYANAIREYKRINLIESDDNSCIDQVSQLGNSEMRILAIDDSSHEFENTLSLLGQHSKFVSKCSYYIVEDTI